MSRLEMVTLRITPGLRHREKDHHLHPHLCLYQYHSSFSVSLPRSHSAHFTSLIPRVYVLFTKAVVFFPSGSSQTHCSRPHKDKISQKLFLIPFQNPATAEYMSSNHTGISKVTGLGHYIGSNYTHDATSTLLLHDTLISTIT